MRTKLLTAVAASFALAAPVLAQTAPTLDAGKIESGSYAVDPYHTQMLWGITHMNFTTFYGRFDTASGTLQLDPKKPALSSVEITVPTDQVDTPVAKLTDELKGDQWFDAKSFPQMTFKSTSVEVVGPHEAKVTGEFTMHGVTKPLTLVARLNGAGLNPLTKKYTVGFQLSGKLKRSDFGMKTYLPLIGDEVDLTISAAFEKG